MKKLTIAFSQTGDPDLAKLSLSLLSHPLNDSVLWITPQERDESPDGIQAVIIDSFFSGAAIRKIIANWKTDYLLLALPQGKLEFGARTLERFLQVAEETGAGLLYSDFREQNVDEFTAHPLIDYQAGSIRDSFDFGSVLLLSRRAVETALEKYGDVRNDLKWGGLYSLRLKLSIDSPILRIPEQLYTRAAFDLRASGEKVFDYLDPRKRQYQIEMEEIAADHLKQINAFLVPVFAEVAEPQGHFPVKASVIIPVRNRVSTIQTAVQSALSQKTDFEFNVIVVDNHSTDGTTPLLQRLSSDDRRLIHHVPSRTDLGIGGCWNEAIYSSHCGRFAVQLDSDDIYSDNHTLTRIVTEFEQGHYAMIIGAYKIVDFDLNELPPGLIDHREWTRENGRNNALRIDGLGAPRAFDVTVLRKIGFPNVSYGEDYAVALRISRDYEIGRVYDPLYFARRWPGNSDSSLSITTSNSYHTYKDRLRTFEILARQKFNAERQSR
ncbi:MAG: glycosyltransferase [Acidobacteria bacterium]|nr:glycosyltransferase [Acidobacteriota bacterium]